MNKITNYKFNKHNLRLSLSDYWDFNLAFDDIYTHTINGCLPSVFFDFNNKNTYPDKDFDVRTIKSLVTWDGAINSGATLNTIGLTGLDNGLIDFKKISGDTANFALLSALTTSQLVIPSGDTKLILNRVTGYTSDIIYPIDIITGATSADTAYAQFCGGFYQGYYKLDGYDYELLPTRVNDAWTAEFWINKQDLCGKYSSGTTLNDLYPNNKGIFFYMGTRAENKFWNTWEGADTGCTKNCTLPSDCTDTLSEWCTIPKENEIYFIGDYGIPIPLSPPQLDIELIKNQFLIYGRSQCDPYESLSGETGKFFKKVDDGFETLSFGEDMTHEFNSNQSDVLIVDDASASPYPITFDISGITGQINKIQLSITGITHSWVGDVGIVLVSPNDSKFTVITGRDAGGAQFNNNNIIISSDSTIELICGVDGTFINKSMVNGPLIFNAPSTLNLASGFYSKIDTFLDLTPEEANGQWKLYVQDFAGGDSGSISNLSIIINEKITSSGDIQPYGDNTCKVCSSCGTKHDGLGNQTVCSYDGEGLVKVTEQQKKVDKRNPFLIYGRANDKSSCNCPSHETDEYGKTTICEYTGSTEDITEYNYNLDTVDNALGFIIKDDGSIGYRLLTYTADCINNVYTSGVTIEEKFSPAGVIPDDKWTYLVIKFITDYKDDCELEIAKPRKGRLLFYIDSKLKFVVDEFDEFIARRLNEYKDKQLGVPFNFSLGGGTQGLLESVTFDGIDFNDINLPIQENFAGTFIGGIQSFKFSTCRVPYEDIVANFNATNINTPIIKAQSGYFHGKFSGTSITYENIIGLTFTLDTQIINNTIKLPISGPSYGYIIVPMEFVQPSEFRNSNEACTGFLIPMLTLGSIIIPDENGFDVKYIIYRTFNKTSGSVDVWFCD